MNASRVNEAIAVRRLDSKELAAAVEREMLHTMWADRDRAHSAWVTADGSAVALVFAGDGPDGGEGWMVVARGTGEQSIQLVDTVRAEVGALVGGLTVPRSAALGAALERWRATDGDDWDLMVCDAPPPPQDGESLVRTGLAAAEVQAFLDRVNPHHSVRADDPTVDLWAGIRADTGPGDGALLAVGALTRRSSGIGYLASIATDPATRGSGFGSAITASLTRRVFDAGEVRCTLAHYHPNEAARRIYLRLGYQTLAQNHSAAFG